MREDGRKKLKELSERLSGRWRVTGKGIEGEAEFKPAKGGALFVMTVDFSVDGLRMKNIQHLAYDERTDSLQARYMDTTGEAAIYTWALEGRRIRVSLVGDSSETYFEATLNDDDSEYVGTWHGLDGGDDEKDEARIVYRRIE